MHIHLDPVGGIAGDMFVAAMLDTWPELADIVLSTIRESGLVDAVEIEHQAFNDGVLAGSRFHVDKPDHAHQHNDHVHEHHHDDGHAHDGEGSHGHHNHTAWSALRNALQESQLAPGIKTRAIGIFTELAQAEAAVHGKDIETVTFHEVGNWDSIADIVGAATIIEHVKAQSWSIGSLPIGHGRVQTAHGELPVPAPATSLLLKGFNMHDDGRPGERVTPTGAAILRYLHPAPGIGKQQRILARTGFGFGTRRLKGMSNVLRVLTFETATADERVSDVIGIIQFEVDDQTAEDLAIALQNIRARPGVLDVSHAPTFGKKGRMMSAIQILAEPGQMDAISEACFRQTTTLGVRTRLENRTTLNRREVTANGGLNVKIVDRPGGATAKTDVDQAAIQLDSHAERTARRQEAEQAALSKGTANGQ